MPTYITLGNLTDQGIREAKNVIRRMGETGQSLESLGVRVRDVYLVTGAYDWVGIFEAPDDETVAKAMLSIGAGGSVRTQTFRAFTLQEVESIIADLP